MKKLAYRRDVPFFCDYSWEDPSDNLLKWNVCVNVKNKVNSVEESVKEKEEDESHEERGEEGIRVICGHCFFLSMCGMWSAYQRYRNLLSIVTGRVGPSLIMGRRK